MKPSAPAPEPRPGPLQREGLLWLLVAVALLITGLLKAINPLTLLACWLLALLLVNYLLARRQFQYLQARVELLVPNFAGGPCLLTFHLENPHKRPRWGLSVGTILGTLRPRWFVAELAPHACLNKPLFLHMPRRGVFTLGPVQVRCGYPFGLVELGRVHGEGQEIVVFPRLGHLQHQAFLDWLRWHGVRPQEAACPPRRHALARTEFHGLRSFQPGDSPRWIHWRSSARCGTLMVREYEDRLDPPLTLIVEAYATDPAQEDPLLERTLSLTATLAWEWLQGREQSFTLILAGAAPRLLQAQPCKETLNEVLTALAREPGTCEPWTPNLAQLVADVDLPRGPVVLLTPRGQEPAAGWWREQKGWSPVIVDLSKEEDQAYFHLDALEGT